MDKNSLFYRRHKLFLQVNKSSPEYYRSLTYRNFIHENAKNDMPKKNSLFTINQDFKKYLFANTHRIILHSKIKSNPKYNKIEIECYSCKNDKKYKNKDFFLTTNPQKPNKKTRNKESNLKIFNSKNYCKTTTNNKIRKNKTLYPVSSTKNDINKYYYNTNKNIKDFINEKRLINKLKYINKLKSELKEKKENEIECDSKLLDFERISLLKSKELLHQFETDRNHYNRHLLDELIMNKQILLKIKLKQSMIEGKVSGLTKKIDELKNKSNLLQEFKNFLLCVKNHASSFDKYLNKTIDVNSQRRRSINNITNNKMLDNNDLIKRNFMKKRHSVFMPILKKNTYNSKQKIDNDKDKNIKKRITFDENRINGQFNKNGFKNNSDSEIFESSYEFNSKMNKIEETLFTLIYRKNKISRDLIELKFKRNKELNSIKTKPNIEPKIKLYEELLNNYKDYNNDLNKKLNSLIKEKDNYSFNNLVYKKIKIILNTINSNYKEFQKYENIYDRLKKLLYKSRYKLKKPFILEGIIIIENFINKLLSEINENAKNYEEENIIEKLRYKIDKEKKLNTDKQYKEEMIRMIKLNKILKKMNKVFIKSRKVPEKIDFTRIKKIKK